MYDGLIDVVKPFVNKKDAVSAWEEYTEASWEKFQDKGVDVLHYKNIGSNVFDATLENVKR